MKPKITLKSIGVLLVLFFLTVESYAQQLTQQFTFSTNDLEISQMDGYDYIDLIEGGKLNGDENAGKPQLPIKYFNLLLPAGGKATNVSITVGQEIQLSGSFNLYPVQLPKYLNFEEPLPFVGQDSTIYGSNTPFPPNQLVGYNTHTYRDYNFVSIAFIPFKYIPLAQKLYLQTHITVTVSYIVHTGAEPHKLRPYNDEDVMAYDDIQKSIMNPSQASGFYPDVITKINTYNALTTEPAIPFETTNLPALEGSEVKYIIITNATLAPHFQQFAKWKTQNGTPAKIVTVSNIKANYPGMDVPEQIRNFIKAAHQLWGTEYVLLGGDSKIVPIRMVHDDMVMATDLYYSAIVPYNDNWNADGDNLFGEPNDGDFTADIAVGRAPVDTPAEVANFLKKNFIYGRSQIFAPLNSIPTGTWLGKTLMGYGAASDVNWNDSNALKVGYEIINKHDDDTNLYRMMEYNADRTTYPCVDSRSWDPAYYPIHGDCTDSIIKDNADLTHGAFITQLTNGYGFTNILDHSVPFSLGIGTVTGQPGLSIQDIQNLSDTHKYGILLASGCHSAPLERDLYFGEQWLNNAGGGVAYYGASAPVWVSVGYAFSKTFFDALFDANVYKLGKVHGFAAWNIPSDKEYAAKIYQVLGDPDLSIFTEEPSNLSITHATSIPLGNQDFQVDINNFPHNEMVLVSIYKDGEVLAHTLTDTSPVILNITPDTQGTLHVTATCHNCNPYEGTVTVGSLNGTHLYKSNLTLTDENGNGIIEPGETIDIGFELSNTGSIDATGIYAELSTEDTNTQITQNTSNYPNIAAGQSGNSNTDYTFTTSIDATTGSAIAFVLTIHTHGQGTFTEPFLLNIQGPVLDMGDRSAEVNGTETDVFSANDAVELFVDIHNLGAIMADDVNAVLTTTLPANIVSIIDGSYLYGDINSYSQATNTDAFDITVGPDYNGEPLLFDLTLTDAFGKTDVFPIDLTETMPQKITNFGYTSSYNKISMFWDPIQNIKGYNVYRSDTETGTYEKMNDFIITSTARYDDFEVQPFTEYWYKVGVVNLSGNELEVALLDANKAYTKLPRHEGFPVQAHPSAASICISSPVVYDINGDGNKELFLDYENLPSGRTQKGKIMGFYANGAEIFDIDNSPNVWGFAPTDLALKSNPAVGDIDNDGNAEVFAIGREHTTNTGKLYGYHTIDSNSDGKPDIWQSTPPIPGSSDGSVDIGERTMRNPVLADLNNDGHLEIIVFDEHQKVTVYDYNKQKIGERQPYNTGYSEGELAVADIDGDGYKEIILSCQTNNADPNINYGAIYVWDHNGVFSGGLTDDLSLLKQFNAGERADNGAVLADIDNDGMYEVLTITRDSNNVGHVYALHVGSGAPVNNAWNGNINIALTSGSYQDIVIPRIAVGDLNNDGNLEIVFGSKDKLYALDNDGNILTGFPISFPNSTMGQSAPILADIDDDNDIEIIINEMRFGDKEIQTFGEVHAFNYDASSCEGWGLSGDNEMPLVASPYIGDIDNDGHNEMVISSTDFTTYVWDTEGDADKVEWGSYRENAQNTAVYKEECTYSSLATVEINTANVIWNTDRHIQGDLVIKPSANLTITDSTKVTFTRNSKLIIEPGGKLTIDGGILTTECGALWKGIRVQGNYNLAQTSANQGTIILKNDAIIEHAEIGIYAGTNPNIMPVNNGAGAIVTVNNAIFRDNIIGIKMPSYPFANSSSIKNSTFENSDYLTNLNHYPYADILLEKVKPILISNNTFKNLQEIDPYSNPNEMVKQGNGIMETDAKMEVWNNHFENLNVSVQAQGTGSSFATTYVYIHNNTFENNWNAVYLNSIDGVEITSNSIDVFDTLLNGQGIDGSSGIYIVSSNGFHIENNNIYSSTAQGFSTGVFIRRSPAANELYKNQFTDLYTGVFAMNKYLTGTTVTSRFVQGLYLTCNEFNDNNTDIYVAPNTSISTYQGTNNLSSGNKFLPECTGSINELNNQGTQVVYFGENSGVYRPDCNYNVNVFTTINHNGCESTLGQPFDNSDIAEKDNEINQETAQYIATTDGGDTEGLNETIDETENNEALQLRNVLLEESPFLSDTIMVKTTTVEDVLPSVMVKDVLSANPKAAKSDKVQQALDNRQNLLPNYMRDEIDLGKTTLSAKENLEATLSRNIHMRESIVNRIIDERLQDSLPGSLDSLKTLLINESQSRISRSYQLVNYYLSVGEVQNAQTVFNNIPQNFTLSSTEENEYNKLSDLLDIKLDLLSAEKTFFEMDSTQIGALSTLAMDSTTIAGMQSRAILSLVNNTDYGLPIPEKVESAGRGTTGPETIPGVFSVYPEMATDYFIVEYALNSNENVKDATIKIMDSKNNVVKKLKVTTRENQLLVECGAWKEGLYWCEKIIHGKQVDKQKVIIDRGNLSINASKEEGVPNGNVFQIFPNPAKDYFFVITNIKSEGHLRISNSLGQVIGNYKINDRQTKISTSSWSKGIYLVSLFVENQKSETIKIIID